MNELKIFENPEFGKVRTVVIDSEPSAGIVGMSVKEMEDFKNGRW